MCLNEPTQAADSKKLNISVSSQYFQLIKGPGGNMAIIPPTEIYSSIERNMATNNTKTDPK
jgi:hypothetical protein